MSDHSIFRCPKCEKSYKRRKWLWKHVIAVHVYYWHKNTLRQPATEAQIEQTLNRIRLREKISDE